MPDTPTFNARLDDLETRFDDLIKMFEHILWSILDDAADPDAVKHHAVKGLTALAVGT